MNGYTPDDGADRCICLWSVTATSATLHNVNKQCPVHGQGVKK